VKKKDMVRRAYRAELEKRARAAKDNAGALVELAATGAPDAAFDLYETAALLTGELTYLCEKNPAQFSAIARDKHLWPLAYGPHPSSVNRANELIKKLQVGAKTSLNLATRKTFSWDKPANVVAFYLYRLAQSFQRAPMCGWARDDYYALITCSLNMENKYEKTLETLEAWGQHGAGRQLPALSRSTANVWAKATPELFRLVYGEKFDEHPELQKLRESVLNRAKTWDKKPGGPGIIKAAMLRAVKQAFSSIAALD
jgi:hypothetical protein